VPACQDAAHLVPLDILGLPPRALLLQYLYSLLEIIFFALVWLLMTLGILRDQIPRELTNR
jgi:hypothetical protein